MPEEMTKLRYALDVRGIAYQDESDDFERSFPFFDMTLYKTHFKHNSHDYMAMSGVGTLGGEWGLLELRVDGGDPVGSVTADYILTLMGE